MNWINNKKIAWTTGRWPKAKQSPWRNRLLTRRMIHSWRNWLQMKATRKIAYQSLKCSRVPILTRKSTARVLWRQWKIAAWSWVIWILLPKKKSRSVSSTSFSSSNPKTNDSTTYRWKLRKASSWERISSEKLLKSGQPSFRNNLGKRTSEIARVRTSPWCIRTGWKHRSMHPKPARSYRFTGASWDHNIWGITPSLISWNSLPFLGASTRDRARCLRESKSSWKNSKKRETASLSKWCKMKDWFRNREWESWSAWKSSSSSSCKALKSRSKKMSSECKRSTR